MRIPSMLAALGATLLIAACSGGGSSTSPTAVPETTESDGAPISAVSEPEPGIAYVANTGGEGIYLRSECREDAGGPDTWPEGTAVSIMARGTDGCASWSYVAGPRQASWVPDAYLSTALPAETVARGSDKVPPGQAKRGGEPMFVYGEGAPDAHVAVFAAGQLCDSARADPAAGLWSLEVNAEAPCSAATGDFLLFTIDGAPALTADRYAYDPGSTLPVVWATR